MDRSDVLLKEYGEVNSTLPDLTAADVGMAQHTPAHVEPRRRTAPRGREEAGERRKSTRSRLAELRGRAGSGAPSARVFCSKAGRELEPAAFGRLPVGDSDRFFALVSGRGRPMIQTTRTPEKRVRARGSPPAQVSASNFMWAGRGGGA
jgi:hypothetical protein